SVRAPPPPRRSTLPDPLRSISLGFSSLPGNEPQPGTELACLSPITVHAYPLRRLYHPVWLVSVCVPVPCCHAAKSSGVSRSNSSSGRKHIETGEPCSASSCKWRACVP